MMVIDSAKLPLKGMRTELLTNGVQKSRRVLKPCLFLSTRIIRAGARCQTTSGDKQEMAFLVRDGAYPNLNFHGDTIRIVRSPKVGSIGKADHGLKLATTHILDLHDSAPRLGKNCNEEWTAICKTDFECLTPQRLVTGFHEVSRSRISHKT